MDWDSLKISLWLGLWTVLLLIPCSIYLARLLAWRRFMGRNLLQTLLALPLLLPPTVLGFYLLMLMGNQSFLGSTYKALFGEPLVFSFQALVIASLIFNIPFAIQPIQRAFESISLSIREAAWCSGLGKWQTFWRIELPLAWQGILSASILTFAHTLGEFGVVLMVGGNIEAETRTVAISIYDRVQAFDNDSAALMSGFLLLLAFVAIISIYIINDKIGARHEK